MNARNLLSTAVAAAFCLLFTALGHAQNPAPLTPAQASSDARIAVRTLRELHPGLLKYSSPAQASASFATFERRAGSAKDSAEFYLAATELAASIRCGHTWTNVRNQSPGLRAVLDESPNKLPFLLKWVEGRWLILASAVPQVVRGDELLAVDGVPAAAMVTQLMPYLRADGASDAKRLAQLSHSRADGNMLDTLWPLLRPPTGGQYAVQVRSAGGAVQNLRVVAMGKSQRTKALGNLGNAGDAGNLVPAQAWQFAVQGTGSAQVGVLTLPTFAFWGAQFDWAGFLARSFAQLDAQGVPRLIIDIRVTEGGDGRIGPALLSYLLKAPFTPAPEDRMGAYERAPYALAKYLETWDFGFFDRTGKVSPRADGRFLLTDRIDQSNTIQPVAKPYAGRVLLLVGGENSSAAYQLAGMMKDSGAATLVGSATGGNRRGLNAGQLAWVVLPASGVAIDIPLVSSEPRVAVNDEPVFPDVLVNPTFAGLAAGRDEVMEAALALLARK